MDVAEDRSTNLYSVLLVCASLFGVTFVLTISYWFTDSGEFHISLIPFYTWELLLYSLSILIMLLVVIPRTRQNNSECNIETEREVSLDPEVSAGPYLESLNIDEQRGIEENKNAVSGLCDESYKHLRRNRLPRWDHIPLRSVILTICLLGIAVFAAFETYRTICNLTCLKSKSSEILALLVLKTLSRFQCVVYCFLQAGVLIFKNHEASKSTLIKHFVSSTLAANFTLCATEVLNTIRTSHTIDLYHETHKNLSRSLKPHVNISADELAGSFLICEKERLDVDKTALSFHYYLYQYPIEFALFSLPFLCRLWNKLGRPTNSGRIQRPSFGRTTSSLPSLRAENSSEVTERSPLLERSNSTTRSLQSYTYTTIICVSRYAFIPTFTLVIAMFLFQLYIEIQSAGNGVLPGFYKTNLTLSKLDNAYSIVNTSYTYVIFIVIFIGFILARKEKTIDKSINADIVILLVGVSGHMLLVLFEAVACLKQFIRSKSDIAAETVSFFIKAIFHYVALYCQAVFIIKVSKMKIHLRSMEKGKQLYIRGIVAFVGLCSLEKWAVDSILFPKVLNHVYKTPDYSVYDQKIWWTLTQYLYPFVILFRILSAVMCFEAYFRFTGNQT